MFKLSIVIPVYFNQDNLYPLYTELKEKLFDVMDFSYELIMVDDGSGDNSWEILKQLSSKDPNIKIYKLSRNFGSHSAILCGISKATGDCIAVKAADMQEPIEVITKMVESWREGNNVVLAVRKGREESFSQRFFAAAYYWLVRKVALPNMPKGGFDCFLLDKKVVGVLKQKNELNSAITGQILWSGFKTSYIFYMRKAREIGKSRWTLRKKIRLVTDTLFSFSNLPITIVSIVGFLSILGAVLWAVLVIIFKFRGLIEVSGWTTLFIFNLFSFGVIMFTLGILGGYLWRTFDVARNRPSYIIEDEKEDSALSENSLR
ncbi:MAG: glycosyltransferase family 2 protein [Clostridiales bacterium]